jgi:hypothetical protein
VSRHATCSNDDAILKLNKGDSLGPFFPECESIAQPSFPLCACAHGNDIEVSGSAGASLLGEQAVADQRRNFARFLSHGKGKSRLSL